MHNYKKLMIWQKSMELVYETYEITKNFPNKEKYGLTSQLNRCSVSIPSNIAEGSSKDSNKYFINFLEHSLGSAFEWETQILITLKLNYINREKFTELEKRVKEIQNIIFSFKTKLKK